MSLVGVLVLVVGTGINANTCTSFLTMICKGVGADGDTLMLVLQNATGQKITINPFLDIKFDDEEGYATVTYNGTVHRFDDVTINAGDEFTISAKGLVHADEVTITYVEGSTGLTRTITSTISTDAPDTIEISNDGIDNDGDGDVDCEAGDVEDCEYVVEANPFGADLLVTNAGPTVIQFGGIQSTTGTTDLAGMWTATGDIALAFYVVSYTPGTTADVSFGILPPVTTTLNQGWNVVTINTGAGVLLMGNNMDDFLIQSNGANFHIAHTELPKAFVNIQ